MTYKKYVFFKKHHRETNKFFADSEFKIKE